MEQPSEHPTPTRQPGMPYREDCWSDGETSALVDAWGERYLELNRGSLRQKQWQEVADAVNTRAAVNRRKVRTDVQCKNRIDTLKKKYKQEKAKILEGILGTSSWPFYSRLDVLIGPVGPSSGSLSNSAGIKRNSFNNNFPASSPPVALPLYRKGGSASMNLPSASPLRIRENISSNSNNKLVGIPLAQALPMDDSFIRKAAAAAAAAAGTSSFPIASSFIRKTPPFESSFIRKNPVQTPPVQIQTPPVSLQLDTSNYFIRKAVAAAAAAKQEHQEYQEHQEIQENQENQEDQESESNSEPEHRSVSSLSTKRAIKKRKISSNSSSSSSSIMELAKAIDKMAEMYERMEEARQREMIESEKQRMELIKRMELQRMQMFADLKVQTERLKKGTGTGNGLASEVIGSVSAVSFLMNPSLI